uniref:Prenyl transferase n=1 Tax=Kuetzingia canaliculata TaxID=228262 RepID=A0A1Z1MP65_KUECA|nr:prenyl transferase [Kuetzingia canaliculata]ARW67887.1 prenyl transferase [Kuetzingia canaliculata]
MTIFSRQIFQSIKQELEQLNINLKKMIEADHPILCAAAEQLFSAGGKRIRPAIVLLIAQITSSDKKISAKHKRLAEITEIIHTASLVHDDIIDNCEIRRGIDTVHSAFNNKIAVLAGDFLFAQSSWYLANLENLNVVKTISKVITDFAEGEVQQGVKSFDSQITIEDYIEKSFYKTASLIACSSKAATMLNNRDKLIQNDFYTYGKHLGLAFQIIDDILDIVGSTKNLGKPAGSDLKNGNLTAPLIFALEERPDLYKFINQEFQSEQDISIAIKLIKHTKGIQKAKDLAEEHIQLAITILQDKYFTQHIKELLLITYYIANRIK